MNSYSSIVISLPPPPLPPHTQTERDREKKGEREREEGRETEREISLLNGFPIDLCDRTRSGRNYDFNNSLISGWGTHWCMMGISFSIQWALLALRNILPKQRWNYRNSIHIIILDVCVCVCCLSHSLTLSHTLTHTHTHKTKANSVM